MGSRQGLHFWCGNHVFVVLNCMIQVIVYAVAGKEALSEMDTHMVCLILLDWVCLLVLGVVTHLAGRMDRSNVLLYPRICLRISLVFTSGFAFYAGSLLGVLVSEWLVALLVTLLVTMLMWNILAIWESLLNAGCIKITYEDGSDYLSRRRRTD